MERTLLDELLFENSVVSPVVFDSTVVGVLPVIGVLSLESSGDIELGESLLPGSSLVVLISVDSDCNPRSWIVRRQTRKENRSEDASFNVLTYLGKELIETLLMRNEEKLYNCLTDLVDLLNCDTQKEWKIFQFSQTADDNINKASLLDDMLYLVIQNIYLIIYDYIGSLKVFSRTTSIKRDVINCSRGLNLLRFVVAGDERKSCFRIYFKNDEFNNDVRLVTKKETRSEFMISKSFSSIESDYVCKYRLRWIIYWRQFSFIGKSFPFYLLKQIIITFDKDNISQFTTISIHDFQCSSLFLWKLMFESFPSE